MISDVLYVYIYIKLETHTRCSRAVRGLFRRCGNMATETSTCFFIIQTLQTEHAARQAIAKPKQQTVKLPKVRYPDHSQPCRSDVPAGTVRSQRHIQRLDACPAFAHNAGTTHATRLQVAQRQYPLTSLSMP